jgi:4a-hydroxytetrahydrobiopterin dehydratase
MPAQALAPAALADQPLRPDVTRLSTNEIDSVLAAALPGWEQRAASIEKSIRFADFHRTMAFVNALAYLAHRADHHPDLGVHFNRCVVAFSTHDAGGVTANDLIMAARVDRLLE